MRQIEDAIASGRLAAGAQLPSHRELSEQLVIAPLTVKKAYDELEQLGYLEQQRGRGTFVRAGVARGGAQAAARDGQAAALSEAVQALLHLGAAAGLTGAQVVQLVEDAAGLSPAAMDRLTRRLLK
jgi:DNA-binding transcriptional regulator YhcF (GntR family)